MVSTFQNYTRYLVIVLFALFLAACETVPKDSATSTASTSSSTAAVEIIDGVYVGSDTVEMLAVDVPDRIFFAYDSYSLTKAAQDTLEKQAKWLKANGSATIAIEGHADERGTREYNLALGDRRANAAKDYLMTQGISSSRVTTISFGKERPVNSCRRQKIFYQEHRPLTSQQYLIQRKHRLRFLQLQLMMMLMQLMQSLSAQFHMLPKTKQIIQLPNIWYNSEKLKPF